MRTLGFIVTFAFILAGPTLAGSSDGGMPGMGTFAYGGTMPADSGWPPLVAQLLAAKPR